MGGGGTDNCAGAGCAATQATTIGASAVMSASFKRLVNTAASPRRMFNWDFTASCGPTDDQEV